MTTKEFEDRKALLADQIMIHVDSEEILDELEEYMCCLTRTSSKRRLPHIASDEELRSVIDQVLEDDKNGLFIDDEDLRKKMETW